MSNKKQIRKKKRSSVLYPGLDKSVNSKTRQDLIDYDYVNKLSPDEKAWLSKFSEEYVSGSFKKTKGGNYSSKNFHKTAKQRRECYSRNNSRNRCSLTIAHATGHVVPETVAWDIIENERVTNPSETEDTLIAILDSGRDVKED